MIDGGRHGLTLPYWHLFFVARPDADSGALRVAKLVTRLRE
jgi:hypothetical protein